MLSLELAGLGQEHLLVILWVDCRSRYFPFLSWSRILERVQEFLALGLQLVAGLDQLLRFKVVLVVHLNLQVS